MSGSSSTIALFGLIGALVGAVPGMLGVVFTWLKNRDSITRSLRKIELAKAEVEFISKWLEVASTLDKEKTLENHRQTARIRLDKLMTQAEAEEERRTVESIEVEETPKRIRKNMGLYIYSGFFFFLLFGASIDKETNNPSLSHLLEEVTTFPGASAILVFGLPWVYFFTRYLIGRWKRR